MEEKLGLRVEMDPVEDAAEEEGGAGEENMEAER